ncbi:hypothetical protein EV182_003299, partial [Spiromyces aspiralis]
MSALTTRLARPLKQASLSRGAVRRFASTGSHDAKAHAESGERFDDEGSVLLYLQLENKDSVGTTHPITRLIESISPNNTENKMLLEDVFHSKKKSAQFTVLDLDDNMERRPLRLANPMYFEKGSPYCVAVGTNVDMSEVAKFSPVR